MLEKLPEQLQELIARSMSLQARVRRLDTTIHSPLDRARRDRQSAGAAAQPAEGRLRA